MHCWERCTKNGKDLYIIRSFRVLRTQTCVQLHSLSSISFNLFVFHKTGSVLEVMLMLNMVDVLSEAEQQELFGAHP